MSAATPLPLIGQPWPGQGGIFAGLRLSDDGTNLVALILSPEVTDSRFTWAKAKAWAKKVRTDGHKDFSLPERFESALLYANVREHIEVGYWYWTGTQSSSSYAFIQNFDYGGQDGNNKSYEGRVRAVRRFPVNPSILSASGQAA
jgi:hypothetical protein